MKKATAILHPLLFAALLVLCACFAHAQVSVSIAPNPFLRFTTSTGAPLAGGFLYTYQAGTTTLQNTYVDSQGTVQNPDPIPLDATGAPSNGSVQTMVWLANLSYKFCLYDSNLVPQGCKDNLTGYLGLLNLANTWTFQQTFSLAILDTLTDNQMIFGAPGNQTTLDFPPPTGNVTVHAPNLSDTLVGRQTTDTLVNKTLNVPLFNSSGCGIVNGPGTYICIANANPTGTTLNTLTTLLNAPSQATIASSTQSSGILGIAVAGAGNTGTATIQESGASVSCVFDGATVASDYVVPSSTTNGDCHDFGPGYPTSGQVIGRVLATNGSGGTFQLNLFGPEVLAGKVQTLSAIGTVAALNIPGTATTPIWFDFVPANNINAIKKTIRLTFEIDVRPAASMTSTAYYGFGPSSSLGSYNPVAAQAGSAAAFSVFAVVQCNVQVTGASGSMVCSPDPAAPGATTLTMTSTTITGNLTVPFYLGAACSFSVTNAANACQVNQFTIEQLN